MVTCSFEWKESNQLFREAKTGRLRQGIRAIRKKVPFELVTAKGRTIRSKGYKGKPNRLKAKIQKEERKSKEGNLLTFAAGTQTRLTTG